MSQTKISRVIQDKQVSFECVEKNQKIIETLKCPICLDFFKEPLMSACGHNLCKDCSKKLPTETCNKHDLCLLSSCPMCREQIHSCMVNRNINLASTIDVLQVKCLQNLMIDRPCSKEIYLEGIENHLKNECEYRVVKCQYGCGYSNFRKLKDRHERICLKNPETKISCPECSESVFAVLLEEHRKNDCSNTIVKCTAMFCIKKIKRCELEQHLKNDYNEHIKLMKNENEFLYKEIIRMKLEQKYKTKKLRDQEIEFDNELQEQKTKFDTELQEQKTKFNTELQRQESAFNNELQQMKEKIRNKFRALYDNRPDIYISKKIWKSMMFDIKWDVFEILDRKS